MIISIINNSLSKSQKLTKSVVLLTKWQKKNTTIGCEQTILATKVDELFFYIFL